jgi:hypothetical protein
MNNQAQTNSEADMTQDSVSDELVKIAQDAYDEFSMRAALTAIAPRLKAEGLREAAEIASVSAWKHVGEDDYSRGMDQGSAHQAGVIYKTLVAAADALAPPPQQEEKK